MSDSYLMSHMPDATAYGNEKGKTDIQDYSGIRIVACMLRPVRELRIPYL